MAGQFRQFVVYTKVALIVAMGVLVLVLVFMNRNYKTNFWPGADQAPVATLWLILATSALSIAVFWVLARTRRVWRELGDLQAEKARQAAADKALQVKAALDDQERRIDQKLKQAMDQDKSQPDHR